MLCHITNMINFNYNIAVLFLKEAKYWALNDPVGKEKVEKTLTELESSSKIRGHLEYPSVCVRWQSRTRRVHIVYINFITCMYTFIPASLSGRDPFALFANPLFRENALLNREIYPPWKCLGRDLSRDPRPGAGGG